MDISKGGGVPLMVCGWVYHLQGCLPIPSTDHPEDIQAAYQQATTELVSARKALQAKESQLTDFQSQLDRALQRLAAEKDITREGRQHLDRLSQKYETLVASSLKTTALLEKLTSVHSGPQQTNPPSSLD